MARLMLCRRCSWFRALAFGEPRNDTVCRVADLQGAGTMFPHAASAFAVFGLLAGAVQAQEPLLEDGSYTVTYRLELPHLERWAVEKTVTVCVSSAGETGAIPLPVMSDNSPYRGCAAKNLRWPPAGLTYDIVCEGRDAARAQATYALTPQAFSGRIAMVMGAKNMTMTEIQTGRRTGGCELAGFGRTHSLDR
jgi:hypothetical protein